MNNKNELNILNTQYTFNSDENSNINERDFIIVKSNKFFISIGKCSKLYLYILTSALFKLLSLMILGKKSSNFGILGFAPILSSNKSMQSIYTYLGYIIFGLIFYFCLKVKKDKKNNLTKIVIQEKIKNQNKKKTYFYIFLIGFSLVSYNELQSVMINLNFHYLDFWTLEVIFTFLFMIKYFKFDIHRHHKCSIIFISLICTIILIIVSFLKGSNGKNQFEIVENDLGSYFYCIIIIFVFIILSIAFAFSRNFAKVIMEADFVSQYTLIIVFGITGLIVTLIISIITIAFDYSRLKRYNFKLYFQTLNESDSTWFILRDILIIIPIYIFSQFMQINFEILTIYYLNPMCVLLLNNLCFAIEQIIFYIFGLDKEKFDRFFLALLAEIIAICGYLVFLEILELNFCHLNDNTKRRIINTGEKEFHTLNIDKIEKIFNENEEDGETELLGIGKLEEISEKRKKNEGA